MAMRAMLLAAVSLLAQSARVQADGDIDLLSALADSEVCAAAAHCLPLEASQRLHREANDGSQIRLPVGAASNLYFGVPPTASLDLEFRTTGATLAITAGSDVDERVLARDDRPVEGWRSVTFDLTPWAGEMVRLRFEPEPRGTSPAPFASVRRLVLRDRTAAAPPAPEPEVSARPNVIVYLIDTLRADHLGCYGYERPTSPRIDRFARSAILFADAMSQSSWTLPATASVLTGRTPRRHGALAVGTAIRPDVPTLAEELRAAGYRTAAFVTNYLASSEFGDARGFDEFHFYHEEAERRPGVYLPSSALRRRVRHWLERTRGHGPFFLYVHATDPHWPYLPAARYARPFRPAEMTDAQERQLVDASRAYFFGNEHHGERPTSMPPGRVAVLRDLYDGDVRAADEAFGRFLDDLAELGLFEHTAVVLTGDHGEEFLDHDGLGHGQTLHDEVLHVPLLLKLPGGVRGGTRIARTVQHVDIAPTALHLAGVAPPPGLEGQSLLLPSGAAGDEVLSHLDNLGIVLDGITTAHWKAIRDLSAPTDGLAPIAVYDREHDRAEQHDLAESRQVLAGYARQHLRAAAAASRPGPTIAPEKLERLRALGYLEP